MQINTARNRQIALAVLAAGALAFAADASLKAHYATEYLGSMNASRVLQLRHDLGTASAWHLLFKRHRALDAASSDEAKSAFTADYAQRIKAMDTQREKVKLELFSQYESEHVVGCRAIYPWGVSGDAQGCESREASNGESG